MKKFPNGMIVFDAIDIACISFSLGSGVAYLVRKQKEKKNVDPLVTELKEKSPILAFSTEGKPLKLPLVRGGDKFKGVSLVIKSKKLATIIRAIINARRKQKLLQLLQIILFTLNTSLNSQLGVCFAVGGSLDYTQFILIAFPSTIIGFLVGQIITNPLASVFLPLAILYGRGIEDIPISDPSEKCRYLCQAAEAIHNKELSIEMVKSSLLENTSSTLQLPRDKVSLVCVEEKLSLLQRFKLRELIETERGRKRVQYFNEFIKKFPECDADPEAVYQQVVEKIIE